MPSIKGLRYGSFQSHRGDNKDTKKRILEQSSEVDKIYGQKINTINSCLVGPGYNDYIHSHSLYVQLMHMWKSDNDMLSQSTININSDSPGSLIPLLYKLAHFMKTSSTI